MDTLITFLNVCSGMWVAWVIVFHCWALIKISTQTTLSRQMDGKYSVCAGELFYPVTFVCIAWLITTQLLATQQIG